ncbi:MAG: type II secretion system F family protein [bacterium]
MPNFEFVVRDNIGRNFKGTLFGPTEQAVFFRLQKQGYIVLSVSEKQGKEKTPFFGGAVTQSEIAIFTRLLGTVISTGLPAQEAIAALEEQTSNVMLRKVVRQVRIDLEQGMSLAAAFEKHPKVFPHLFVSMVHSGEIGGNIPEVLERVADYLEKDEELKRAIQQAFTYPKIIMTVAVVAVAIIMFKVIPAYAKIYAQSKFTLPFATRVLINTSNFVIHNWIALAAAGGLSLLAYFFLKNHPSGRAVYDRFFMNMPLTGQINRRILISRTVHTLGSMLRCGVPLITSLETTKSIVNNVHIEKDIDAILESVEAGGSISTTLRMSKNFLPIVTYMISAGEQSGRLPELLISCSEALDKELAFLTKRLIIILEPLLTIFVACIVAFIAIAMYLPIFSFLTFVPK